MAIAVEVIPIALMMIMVIAAAVKVVMSNSGFDKRGSRLCSNRGGGNSSDSDLTKD